MTTISTSTNWVVRSKRNSQPRLRLFCFPYAGAGASIFRTWSDKLPIEIEVCAVQLPGREGRLREPLFTQLSPLIETLATVLFPYLDLPFAFFGHSMGALVTFELARVLSQNYHKCPKHLFVSGRRAPQIPNPNPPIHQLPEALFIEELRRYNGTSEVVLQSEMMSLFLPILRADFAINERYIYTNDTSFNCPISAFGGMQDREVSCDDIAAWRDQTKSTFVLHMFPGDHFFLNNQCDAVLSVISNSFK